MVDFYGLIRPFIFRFDPERAHGLAIAALRRGWVPARNTDHEPMLNQEIWGRTFRNPIGLAAGFDKDAQVPMEMLGQGFGFVEIGSVTPRPQAGNPKPRLFRLSADEAVVNRMGFNNAGADTVAANLARLPTDRPGPIGVNLGKNKETEDAVSDYVAGIEKLARFADYLVVNVSSPNTPGLRALQGKEPLAELLRAVKNAVADVAGIPSLPILLKVAPDLTDDDRRDIAEVVLAEKIDGIIATNTTIERPAALRSAAADEAGGLSGKPLMASATKVLSDLYTLTEGRVPMIGVGGVASGADAYAKIRAGASLVQLYSALVYGGPGLVRQINSELIMQLRRDGFSSVAEAVGANHR